MSFQNPFSIRSPFSSCSNCQQTVCQCTFQGFQNSSSSWNINTNNSNTTNSTSDSLLSTVNSNNNVNTTNGWFLGQSVDREDVLKQELAQLYARISVVKAEISKIQSQKVQQQQRIYVRPTTVTQDQNNNSYYTFNNQYSQQQQQPQQQIQYSNTMGD